MSEQLAGVLRELKVSIEGMRIEVEAWRTHTSSTGGFILDELEACLKALESIQAKLQ